MHTTSIIIVSFICLLNLIRRSRIFKIGSKFDKHPPFYNFPPLAGTFFQDPSRESVLPRRHMLAPGFNRDGVRRAEGRLAEVVTKLFEKLNQYADTRKPVDLTRASMCLMADGVMNFAYQKPYGALDAVDFESEVLMPVNDNKLMQQWASYFPNLFKPIFRITDMLPTWVLEKYLKSIRTQQRCLQVSQKLCNRDRYA